LALAVSCGLRAGDDEFHPHVAHIQFLSGATPGERVELHEERLREGGASRHHRVLITQGGRNLAAVELSMMRSDEDELEEGSRPPRVARPSELAAIESPFVTRWGFDVLEIRHVNPDATHPMWVRPRVPLPSDPVAHGAALAFVSDLGLVLVGRPAGLGEETVPVTADHTVWYHRPPVFDDWLLLDAQLVVRRRQHGLVNAQLFNGDGHRVATISQSVRLRGPRP
jgi:acyl-CoA thioesterase-2